jgi:hypothetical protein
MSTTPHLLLISLFHNVSDQLSFISHILSANCLNFLFKNCSILCRENYLFFRKIFLTSFLNTGLLKKNTTLFTEEEARANVTLHIAKTNVWKSSCCSDLTRANGK